MITLQEIENSAPIYKKELRRLGFKGTHKPRTPEKERLLIESTVAYLKKFTLEKGEDGVWRFERIRE
jgi:hypothetical protein